MSGNETNEFDARLRSIEKLLTELNVRLITLLANTTKLEEANDSLALRVRSLEDSRIWSRSLIFLLGALWTPAVAIVVRVVARSLGQ